MTNQTVSSVIERTDFRRRRVQAMAAAIMQEIMDVDPDADAQAIYGRLCSVLYANGAAWTTENERAAMGFEPRDELGWTPSELVDLKRRHGEAMQMIMAAPVSSRAAKFFDQ